MKEHDAQAHVTDKLQAGVDISAAATFRVVVYYPAVNWLYVQLVTPCSAAKRLRLNGWMKRYAQLCRISDGMYPYIAGVDTGLWMPSLS